MKRAASCLVAALLVGCAIRPSDPGAIDLDVRRLMQREHVQGLAIAIVDDGRVVHVAAFGRRDVARDLLSNDVRAERLYPELVDAVLGETSMRWAWEYGWLDDAPKGR